MTAIPAPQPDPQSAGLGRMDDAFLDALDTLFHQRRDVRRFLTTPVDEATVTEILTASCTAPSVGLSQPTRLIRLDSQSARDKVIANFEAANQRALKGYDDERAELYATLKLAGLREAPVQFAVFCDTATAKGRGLGSRTIPETLVCSTACAVMTMWLAASARGLGLGWVSIFNVEAMVNDLDVPTDWTFVGCLCIGWPEEYHLDPELERAGWEQRNLGGPYIEVR